MSSHSVIRHLVQHPAPEQQRLAEEFAWGSTWKLVGLTVITLGIHAGFFALRSGRTMNRLLPDERAMSERFLTLVLNLQILSVGLLVPYVLLPEGHWIETVSDATDWAGGLGLLVWGFRMKSRAQELFGSGSGFAVLFGGLWTFLFSPFYFNFKINQLLNDTNSDAV